MIVTISRIQHRMGLQEDLPQLAPGELGWAIDTRRLYIGNGAVEDGAPPAYTDPNNTEIITEHSIDEIIGTFPLYQYEGNGTVTLITGPNALNPVYRTIQDRLDDYVSVKAFGASGDGSTDDTAAINKALYELYVHDNTNFNKKILLFPAGDYQITGDLVKVPRNARIMGEGMDCTFITQTDSSINGVLFIADSLQQTGVAIGTNGASYPGNNNISNLTLRHINRTYDIVKMDMSTDVIFDSVKFENDWNTGDGATSGAQAVNIISSNSAYLTTNIKFNNCEFYGHEYVNRLDYDAVNVIFNNCKFNMCYRVASIGENITGSGSRIKAAYGYRIVNSYFDKIYESAIKTFPNVHSVTSANNYFYNVGNSNTSITGYNYDIIVFTDSGNISIGDFSEREDSNEVIKQVKLGDSGSMSVSANHGIYLNRYQSYPSQILTLANNTFVSTSTGIAKSYSYNDNLRINYTILRNNQIRFGEMQVTTGPFGLSLSESYEEPGSAVGVTFTVVSTGGSDYEIHYETTNTGFDAIFKYQINSMR